MMLGLFLTRGGVIMMWVDDVSEGWWGMSIGSAWAAFGSLNCRNGVL